MTTLSTTAPEKPGWLSRLLDSPVPPGPPLVSVRAIPERRAFFSLGQLEIDPPAGVTLHKDVVLRHRQGVALTAEIAVPAGIGPFPAIVYFHGGAWCVWSAATVRRFTMRLARAGTLVISVNYGLAPEHPFPWAVEDAIYAIRWASHNLADYNGDPARIAVGGDSSGANLAAAALVFLNGYPAELDEGEYAGDAVDVSAAVLVCGAYDFLQRMRERPTTPGTTEIMANLAYLGTHFLSKVRDPLVSPVHAPNLHTFPPTYVSVGDEDSVLHQSLNMTEALADSDVPVTLSVVSGGDHECLLLGDDVRFVARESNRITDWLEAHLAAPKDVSGCVSV
jgi:acetyl esterase